MKKEIVGYHTEIDLESIFDDKSSLEQVIESLSNKHTELFDHACTNMGAEITGYKFKTAYDCSVHIEFYRMETDKEYDKRLRIEKNTLRDALRKKRLKEKKERAEYERLKKKFGEMPC